MIQQKRGDIMRALIGREEKGMTNLEAVKKHREKLMEFKIRPYIAEGQKIREYATAHGMSVQGLFLEAVREYMAKHKAPQK